MCLESLIHQFAADLGRKTSRTNLLLRFGEIFGHVIERSVGRNNFYWRQRDQRPIQLLQHAAGSLGTRNKRFDEIFFCLRRPPNRDEFLARIDEHQAVTRAIPRRLGDQPAILGESSLQIIQCQIGRSRYARDSRKALGRDLVEGEMGGRRSGAREWNAAHLTHGLKLAVLRVAAVQAEHQNAILGLGPVKRQLDGPDARRARFEWVLERARMLQQHLGSGFMYSVIGIPEPQFRIRQRLMHRLSTSDRYEALFVGAAEKDGNPHQFCSIPIRLISQCSSIPEWSFTRLRTNSPRLSISRALELPVLIKKLQCISETCAPPTRNPRQPAASISFQALWPGGFLKVEPPVFSRIGCALSRWFCTSFIRARIASGVATRPRKRAEVKMMESSMPLFRSLYFMSAFESACFLPSRAIPTASIRTSMLSAPLAPSFMRSDPLLVP